MATIDYISDWQKKLRKRLYQQFRTKVTWQALADMLAAQFQDLEDAAQSVLSIVSIDDSEGVQLDQIGALIGQPRLGATDATYRRYLKARVLVNRCTGTTPLIYGVFNALLGSVGFRLETIPTKTFKLTVVGAISALQAEIAALFLRVGKDSGARGILSWQQANDSALFTFAGGSGAGFNVGVFKDAKQV